MPRKKGADNFIQAQRVRIRHTDDFGQSQNYEKWVKDQERYDASGVANPDILCSCVDEPLTSLEREEIEVECQNRARDVIQQAKKILTPREFEVFELLAINFKSMSKAAQTISKRYDSPISKSAIQSVWINIRAKFDRHGII